MRKSTVAASRHCGITASDPVPRCRQPGVGGSIPPPRHQVVVSTCPEGDGKSPSLTRLCYEVRGRSPAGVVCPGRDLEPDRLGRSWHGPRGARDPRPVDDLLNPHAGCGTVPAPSPGVRAYDPTSLSARVTHAQRGRSRWTTVAVLTHLPTWSPRPSHRLPVWPLM